MPRKIEKKERGVFEKEPGSEIWWIRYYIDGRERREKVGRRGDAIKLYKVRKTDALRGVKLPANMKHKGLRFKVIAQEAIDWYIEHGRKDVKSFRIRMNILLKDFGDRIADDIKPSDIDAWLSSRKCAPATKNRYKNVFGRTFKNALASGKVTSNPARLVEQRPENNARVRFLSDDEETIVRAVITKRCPKHMEEFDIALNSGMRKGEQYSLEWPEVHFKRKRIKLDETKNGSSREIPMNKTCLTAFEALYSRRPHNGRVCQSKFGEDLNDSRSWFEAVIEEAAENMPSLERFTWHCLRHTFISRLVMAGVDLRTVQELAGHKTISMTVRYAHLAPEHNQAAIEKLDRKPAKTVEDTGRQKKVSKSEYATPPVAQDDPHGNSVSSQT
jgi:site-specific recombinase XerD